MLESREEDLLNQAKLANARFEEAHRNMVDAQDIERKRLEAEYGREKQLLEEELRVNEVLNA